MMGAGWVHTAIGEIVSQKGLQIGPFGSQLKASEYTNDSDCTHYDRKSRSPLKASFERRRHTFPSARRSIEDWASIKIRRRLALRDWMLKSKNRQKCRSKFSINLSHSEVCSGMAGNKRSWPNHAQSKYTNYL